MNLYSYNDDNQVYTHDRLAHSNILLGITAIPGVITLRARYLTMNWLNKILIVPYFFVCLTEHCGCVVSQWLILIIDTGNRYLSVIIINMKLSM